jgi:hypothetical protein
MEAVPTQNPRWDNLLGYGNATVCWRVHLSNLLMAKLERRSWLFGKTQALYALWLWHRLTSWCLPRLLVKFDLPFCLVPGVRVLAMLALQTRLAFALRVMHLISPWL